MEGFEAFGDRIVVRRDRAGIKSALIIIPDSVGQETLAQGEVVSVGEGRLMDNGSILPLRIKVGDRIVFGKFLGSTFKLGEDEYHTVCEEDIIGWIKRADTSQS